MAAVSSLLSNTILPIDHVKKSSKHRNIIHINIHSSRSVSRNNSNIETNRHELLKYQSRFISTSSTPSSSLNNDKENELIEQIDCSKSTMDTEPEKFGMANEQAYHSTKNNKRNSYCRNSLCLKILLISGCLCLILGAILGLSLALGLTLSSNSNHISVTTSIINTTTTTQTTISTTTTTTTAPIVQILTDTNDVVLGLWNTVAGGNQTITTPGFCIGCHHSQEIPEYAIDRNISTKYTNYGSCGVSVASPTCGIHTGMCVVLHRGSSLLLTFRFSTGNNLPERDPLTVTIEGSNQPSSAFILSSVWTLIYNGSTGLDTDPGRYSYGIMQNLTNNIAWYKSYRILISSKRNATHNAVQYNEIELYGK